MCQGSAVKESRLIEQARLWRSHARLPPARLLLRRKDPRAEKSLRNLAEMRTLDPITFVRALIRREPRLGRLPVGGGSQVVGHQQECREDQGVHNRDRDHASGKTAVMIIKVRP